MGLSIRDPRYPWHNLHEFEKHHPLMKGARYRQFWLDRGLSHADVEGWTVLLDKDIHRAITESGWWERTLLGEIERQERRYGRLLQKYEVIGIANKLMDEVLGWLQ